MGAAAIRVVVIIPSVIRVIKTAVIVIITNAVAIVPIPCIQVAPAVAVANFHAQVAVVIIVVVIGIFFFFLLFRPVRFFLGFGGRIVNIVRGLAGLIGSSTTAEDHNGQRQE